MKNCGQFSKKWEDLSISDNFIFCKVMQDEKLCIKMLEILLGIKIKNIDYIRSENIIENYYQSRGIRMDVFVQNSDRVFDIEMQTGNYSDLLLRSRYYQGAMDVATMERSTSYSDLKESYIIFICKDDPFGFGCASYTKSVTFKECPDFLYNDKSNVVF